MGSEVDLKHERHTRTTSLASFGYKVETKCMPIKMFKTLLT